MQEKFGIFLFRVRVGVFVRNNTTVSNGNCLARIGRDRVVVVELQHWYYLGGINGDRTVELEKGNIEIEFFDWT